jgi:hypothetical protein
LRSVALATSVREESSPRGDSEPVAAELQTVKHLDDAVARIRAQQAAGARSLHAIGVEIERVRAGSLWSLRLVAGSCPYKSFEQWVEAELSISRQHAYRLAAVAKRFSDADVVSHGVSRLAIALYAPEGRMPSIFAALEDGASCRKLEGLVRTAILEAKAPRAKSETEALTSEAPETGPLRVTPAASANPSILTEDEKEGARRANELVAQTPPSAPTLTMLSVWTKGFDIRLAEQADGTRAGQEECENRVWLHAVLDGDVLRLTPRRPSEEEAE